jgi:hypothetical protein
MSPDLEPIVVYFIRRREPFWADDCLYRASYVAVEGSRRAVRRHDVRWFLTFSEARRWLDATAAEISDGLRFEGTVRACDSWDIRNANPRFENYADRGIVGALNAEGDEAFFSPEAEETGRSVQWAR